MEEKKQPNYKDEEVLRTYTSDMVDAIRTDEASVIKIALAEKEKREREELFKKAEGTKTSKIFLTIGSIILIVAAIAGSYYLFQKKKEKETPAPTSSEVDTFITYNAQSYIDVTGVTNIIELLNAIKQQEPQIPGLVKILFLTKGTGDNSETITSKEFLSLVGTNAPSEFIRSLSGKYLLGRYLNTNAPKETDREATFLILQTSDYNQAYASALSWEKTMLKDLSTLFNINIPDTEKTLFDKSWKDIIVSNKDARVLYRENGEAVLYYVFVNKNDLVITNSMEAMKEIIARIITKNAQPL